MLVQLFVIFYGLPSIGVLLDAFPAALIGFTLNVGAYTSEIIRAAISSVPKGQWEAAYSTGGDNGTVGAEKLCDDIGKKQRICSPDQ